jgi:hypothetical protein
VLIRARTGKISCNRHLFDIDKLDSPHCNCGPTDQTVHHLLLECPKLSDLRRRMWDVLGREVTDRRELLCVPDSATVAALFLAECGAFPEFKTLGWDEEQARRMRGIGEQAHAADDNHLIPEANA